MTRQSATNDTDINFTREGTTLGSAPAAAAATGTLTLTGNALDTETVVIGSKTYTFQDTLTDVDGNVHIGASASDTLANLIAAINNSGGTPGTDYATSNTIHPDVSATAGTGGTATITAKVAGAAGNDIGTSETLTNGSFGTASLEGGTDIVWHQLQPNNISSFAPQINTVARDPISKLRQQRKGTVTELNSSPEFESDVIISTLEDLIEGFLFSTLKGVGHRRPSAVTNSTTVTLPSYNSTEAGYIQYAGSGAQSLFYFRGFAESGNNGMKPIEAAVTSDDTTLTFSGLTAEASPPANAQIELAGIRASSDDLSMSRSGSEITITSAADITFTDLGLNVGQFIHIGGLTSTNQFAAGTGYGRIKTINSSTLVLDRIRDSSADGGSLATFTSPDNGSGKAIDLLFGRFIKNVATDTTDYQELSYLFEAVHANLGSDSTDRYVYAKGNKANTLTFNVNTADKATMTLSFVGTDTENPTSSRSSGASSSIAPVKNASVNTAADFARLIVVDTDDTGLTADIDSVTLTLDNGLTPKNVIGQLGPKFIFPSNFKVSVSTSIYFTNENVPARIRNNTTVGMYIGLRNGDDGGVFIDIPSMTLGGGEREFTQNEAITMQLEGSAFVDDTLNTSLGISFFPALPTS